MSGELHTLGVAELARRLNAVLDDAEGPVLVFCASGFRSALLWAIARAARGESIDDLLSRDAGLTGHPEKGIDMPVLSDRSEDK